MEVAKSAYFSSPFLFHLLFTIILLSSNPVLSIRFPDRIPELPKDASNQPVQTAVFALGSFWRSEASFGCLNGIVRTTVGYAGGSKPNPEYRNLGDHAECVQVEYDPRVIGFRQLLEVFWASHDSRQVLGKVLMWVTSTGLLFSQTALSSQDWLLLAKKENNQSQRAAL